MKLKSVAFQSNNCQNRRAKRRDISLVPRWHRSSYQWEFSPRWIFTHKIYWGSFFWIPTNSESFSDSHNATDSHSIRVRVARFFTRILSCLGLFHTITFAEFSLVERIFSRLFPPSSSERKKMIQILINLSFDSHSMLRLETINIRESFFWFRRKINSKSREVKRRKVQFSRANKIISKVKNSEKNGRRISPRSRSHGRNGKVARTNCSCDWCIRFVRVFELIKVYSSVRKLKLK